MSNVTHTFKRHDTVCNCRLNVVFKNLSVRRLSSYTLRAHGGVVSIATEQGLQKKLKRRHRLLYLRLCLSLELTTLKGAPSKYFMALKVATCILL